MGSVLRSLLLTLRTLASSRAALHLEILALRHQLDVRQRTPPHRVRLAKADRWLWVMLARVWAGWRAALVFVQPETVIAWHRQGFRLWWTWKSRHRVAPRIHGELTLGLEVCQSTVAKYMRCRRPPPAQTWRTFLNNHVGQIVGMVG